MQQQPTGGGQYGVPDFVNSSANRPSPQPHMLGISEPQSQPSQQHTLQPQQQQQQQNIMQSRPPPPPQQLQQQQQSSPPKGLDNISDSQSPISQRNIQSQTQNAQSTQSQQRSAFEQQLQLVPNNSFGDHDDAVLAAEDGERGPVGNRWPRQETLALLKIRSDMDAAFRDASLKGPLWEDVSRKLAELGYHRSAKKCKEKFENVQKYYKRTKDGRAGRQDGKSYRFFTQLEALHNNNSGNPMTTTSAPNTTSHMNQSSNNPRVNVSNALTMSTMTLAPPPRPIQMTPSQPFHTAPSHPVDLNPGPINSGMDMKSPFMYKPTFSSSSESSDDEYEEQTDSRKRKRSSSGTAKKMMTFFEQLIKQIMERQEMMQQKFLEAIEKREQDRMIREEAWKRQEMARLNREHEIMAQERSLAASRDAAFIAFLQKITGQTIQIPIVPPLAQSTTTVTTVPPMNETHNSRVETTTTAIQVHHQHQLHHAQHHGHHQQQQHHHQQDVMNTEQNDLSSFDPGSSRWPKPEVHALIRLRSSMESRYQDAGPKGPLWEEISNGMSKLGYNRSAKRCKEKWENINKYFKKVKESNKKRPEDAKTCPYFHQLDQLYKRKQMSQTPKLEHPQQQQLHNENPQDQQLPASGEKVQESQQQNSSHEILAIMPPPNPENETANAQSSNQPTIPTSNGTTMQTTFYSSSDHGEKKQESLNMMDVMVDMEALQTEHSNQPQKQQRHAPPAVEDYDTDKMEADEDDDDEEDEDEDDSENTSDQDPHQQHIQQHRHAIPAPIAHDQRTMEHLPFAQFVHETRNPAQNTAAATAAASSFMAMVHRLNPTENPEFKSSKA